LTDKKVHPRTEKLIYAVKSLSANKKVHLRCEKSIYGRKSPCPYEKVCNEAKKHKNHLKKMRKLELKRVLPQKVIFFVKLID